MAVVRLQPSSLRLYASKAQSQFDEVRAQLHALVNDTIGVQYPGPNAVELRTRSTSIAIDFAADLGRDLSAIAEAVRAATSSISGALGGPPISIYVNTAPIAVPSLVPSGDEVEAINHAALEALRASVTRRIGVISSLLDAHLRTLQSTHWTGAAKDNAVSAVGSLTGRAKSRASEAGIEITAWIDSELETIQRAPSSEPTFGGSPGPGDPDSDY